jgi:hypothetical protein
VIRRILASTVAVEALVVGGYGVSLIVDSMTQKATEPGAAIALAVSAGVICAGLLIAVRAASRARRAARAPIIVWQILQAAVAKEALAAGSFWGILLLVLSVLAVVGVFWPGVLREEAPTG